MQDLYSGDHSIVFGDKHTWDDWHLMPSSRPLFLPPDVKTNYVDLPGTDGHADITEALTGEVLYKNRQGSIEFYVDNGHTRWEYLYSDISNYLHGQKMRAYLTDDPGFYYEGRFAVNKWESNKYRSSIVIDYNVAPYKMDMYSSAEDWLWNPFDFNIGVIREYNNIRVNGHLELSVVGSRKTVIPYFRATLDNQANPILLSWEKEPGKNFALFNGESKLPDIKIKDETVKLYFDGQGIITVDYRGGSL